MFVLTNEFYFFLQPLLLVGILLILKLVSHASDVTADVFCSVVTTAVAHLSFSLVLWSDLFCHVLVPDTLAFHLLYLDEMRLFVFSLPHSLWPQNVYLYLSRMKNQHRHWVY